MCLGYLASLNLRTNLLMIQQSNWSGYAGWRFDQDRVRHAGSILDVR
jgi:hypothetical protein